MGLYGFIWVCMGLSWVYHGFIWVNHGFIMGLSWVNHEIYHYGWIKICGDFLDLPVGFLSLIWGISWENFNLTKLGALGQLQGGKLAESYAKLEKDEGIENGWCELQGWQMKCGPKGKESCSAARKWGSLEELRRSSWEDECGVWTTLTVVLFMNESEIGSGRPW